MGGKMSARKTKKMGSQEGSPDITTIPAEPSQGAVTEQSSEAEAAVAQHDDVEDNFVMVDNPAPSGSGESPSRSAVLPMDPPGESAAGTLPVMTTAGTEIPTDDSSSMEHDRRHPRAPVAGIWHSFLGLLCAIRLYFVNLPADHQLNQPYEDAYNNHQAAAPAGMHSLVRRAASNLVQCIQQVCCVLRDTVLAVMQSAYHGIYGLAIWLGGMLNKVGAMLRTTASWIATKFLAGVHVLLMLPYRLAAYGFTVILNILHAVHRVWLLICSKASGWWFVGSCTVLMLAIACSLGSDSLQVVSIKSMVPHAWVLPYGASDSVPESVRHVREFGSKALNNTAEGILSIATLAKESEALMMSNSKTLSTAADVAVYYGMRSLRSAANETRKEQIVNVGKKLHMAAYDSRMLAHAERTLCTDSAFEYQNITVHLHYLYYDLQVGLATGKATVLAQKVLDTYDSLHAILDWAVREDGTYVAEKHLGQERAKLARQLQTISLEISLLVPSLPSLADDHKDAAAMKTWRSARSKLQADNAWFKCSRNRHLGIAWSSQQAAMSHTEAAKQLQLVQAALQEMYTELTSGSVHAHMQSLMSKQKESLISRERLLTVLHMAKSVSVDPGLAKYLIEFLNDMMEAVAVASSKAADTCAGSTKSIGSDLSVVKVAKSLQL